MAQPPGVLWRQGLPAATASPLTVVVSQPSQHAVHGPHSRLGFFWPGFMEIGISVTEWLHLGWLAF
jgi:hypothetical protein